MKALVLIAVLTLAGAACMTLTGRSHPPLPAEARADRIVVLKSARCLTLYREGIALKTYAVALGRQPVGKKERQGDNRTPEGLYAIDRRNARTLYHRSLHISYPSAADAEAARSRGLSPGGDVMIHGLPKEMAWLGPFHRLADWTAGCIAVTNAEIEEIDRAVPDGTAVEIRP